MQNLEKPVIDKTPLKKEALIKNWAKGYKSQPNEYQYWIEDIEGSIPPELQGTLFRNGPALFEVNGQKVGHIFDGDGMISAITFAQGKAYFQNRYVRTEGYIKEQSANKILYRGFGTQKSGGCLANIFDLQAKNVANTNIIYWAGKLLALWEPGHPHQLSPHNLETIGIDNLNGLLEPNEPFSAHPRIIDNILVNFGVKSSFTIQKLLSQDLIIWEFDAQGNKLKQKSYPLEGFSMLHDMLVTPNYYIFIQHPFQINALPFVLGLKSIDQCFSFDKSKPSKIIIISRYQDNQMEVIETDSFFGFHFGNAWEKENKIYFQSIYGSYFPLVLPKNLDMSKLNYDQFPLGKIYQFEVSLDSQSVVKEKLDSHNADFPCVHPNWVGKENRYIYMNVSDSTAGGPLQNIMKLDLKSNERQIWNPSPTAFAGEPVFVPHPNENGEDQGWLLSLVYDSSTNRSYLAVLSAQNIDQVVAKLHLNHHIPHGFHGSWTSEVFI